MDFNTHQVGLKKNIFFQNVHIMLTFKTHPSGLQNRKKKSKKNSHFSQQKRTVFDPKNARCREMSTDTNPEYRPRRPRARPWILLSLNIQICISISILIFKPRIQSPRVRGPPDLLSAYPHPYVHYPDYPHYPAYPDSKILRNPQKSTIKIPSSIRQNKNIWIF